ncbi:MAG: glycine reductase [Proteobacteria bacterium]|nr:glycine reductase [Pseudomonadota bacterium]MBU1138595.1 glycine reductase [Pseudomonadota bacterium]
MVTTPVIKNCSYCLVHVPDLVQYGSKPRREIIENPSSKESIAHSLRSYNKACCYPPNQTFVGNLSPDELGNIPRPWFENEALCSAKGKFGEILDQKSFYGLLKLADVLNPPLFAVDDSVLARLREGLAAHPLLAGFASRLAAIPQDVHDHSRQDPSRSSALAMRSEGKSCGWFYGDERAEGKGDDNLGPYTLLENLCTKASGALALTWLLHREKINPEKIDFLISCGEEACGDRYQRGGGGMAKAIGEMCGCTNASGMDIKNFCAAPASAIITAAAMVKAGLYKRVAVIGGGSLAKLGMKFQSFLEHGIPILDDCLASTALLISEDDGASPIIRLEPGAVGTVPAGAGFSDEAVFRHYLLAPLESLGLKCTDIDRYAAELHNPEIMEFAGSGDVASKNYRKIAAMAVLAKQLEKSGMNAWIERVGMPGFAPTQGHIPSAVPYIGHAMEAMNRGEIKRVMFLARASLFLNRCTNLLDGVSFVLERNPRL